MYQPPRRRFGRLVVAAAVIVPLAAVAGCGGDDDGGDASEDGISVTAHNGTTISVDAPVERIVCLTGLCDDAAIELGLVPVATTTPALVTRDDFLGADGEEIPVVPGFFGAEDVEAIVAFEPDLVVGLVGVHEGLAEAIEEFAPLWLAETASVEDSISNLETMAGLTDRTDEGAAAAAATRDAVESAQARAAEMGLENETVLLMFGSSSCFGVEHSGTWLGGLLATMFDYPWPAQSDDPVTAGSYSIEEILANDPGTIFAASFVFGPTDETVSEQFADDPAWQRISAVVDDRVVEVLPQLWLAGRGTRSVRAVLDETLDAFE